jgi:hypothetical protein
MHEAWKPGKLIVQKQMNNLQLQDRLSDKFVVYSFAFSLSIFIPVFLHEIGIGRCRPYHINYSICIYVQYILQMQYAITT